jgi:hypothetical protein
MLRRLCADFLSLKFICCILLSITLTHCITGLLPSVSWSPCKTTSRTHSHCCVQHLAYNMCYTGLRDMFPTYATTPQSLLKQPQKWICNLSSGKSSTGPWKMLTRSIAS